MASCHSRLELHPMRRTAEGLTATIRLDNGTKSPKKSVRNSRPQTHLTHVMVTCSHWHGGSKCAPVTVMRPSGSWVTMWSREAEAVSLALGSTARGRRPLQALCTSLRRTSTVRYSEMASRMNWISFSLGCGRAVISELLSAHIMKIINL